MNILIVRHGRDGDDVCQRLTDGLRSHHSACTITSVSADAAAERFRADAPDITFVMAPGPLDGVPEVVARLQGGPGQHTLVVGPATDPKTIMRAMHAGADLFLDQDDLDAELKSALSRFRCRSATRERVGHLIAVLSTGGGCGASTLAVNIAALKAKEHGCCHLIDLNSGKADLAPLLDLTPQYTLADLCRNEARLDRALYEKLVVRHESGIVLLAAPRELGYAHFVTHQGVGQALTLARAIYPQVVADLEDCFHEEQFVALQQATNILLVCRLDFTAIRNVRRTLDHLAACDIPRHRVKIVVNHFGRPNEVRVEDAEEALGEKLTHFVPYDPALVCSANNAGVPAALSDPTSKVVTRIAGLVGLDESRSGHPSGFMPAFRRLLRKKPQSPPRDAESPWAGGSREPLRR